MTAIRRMLEHIAFREILFLTDFSEPSQQALALAVAIARCHSARVNVMHVMMPSASVYLMPEAANVVLEDQEGAARAAMQHVQDELAGIPCETTLTRGASLWEEVARTLASHPVDLIVLGTHGRRGFQKAVLGSSAEGVLRRSPVPVLTSGPGNRAAAGSSGKFRCILLATDFNDARTAAAGCAVSLARENQAQLVLAHVLASQKARHTARGQELSVAEALHRLEELVPADGSEALRPQAIVEHGAPAARIVALAANRGADLIVLGVRRTGSLGGAAARLHSGVAYEVVANAPCPVLTVRQSAAGNVPENSGN